MKIFLKCNGCNTKFSIEFDNKNSDNSYYASCPNCGHFGYRALNEISQKVYEEGISSVPGKGDHILETSNDLHIEAKENDINNVKVKWKIPDSKLSSFNCEWTKDSVNPFPFILRKSHYTNGYYVVELIGFNNLETARYQRLKVYEREEKDTELMYPYSDWNIVKDNNKAAYITITTDEILKALNMGFEWIHIDETVEWFMNIHGDSAQPCWMK